MKCNLAPSDPVLLDSQDSAGLMKPRNVSLELFDEIIFLQTVIRLFELARVLDG